MGTVDDYLETLDEPRRGVITALYAAAHDAVPDAEQGKGYGMPALVYRGKPLVSVMATASHLALYPFSGEIVGELADELAGFDASKGTIRFQPDAPLPTDLAVRIVEARKRQIDR
ncbi:uncharacterized protein YdhG (YjbR/CyaY superfamily) [Mumia flava]|uniref:Uncharacterized protein YdhG (YjbR/CyaY superfamily) n=1 Tax=Mumia flava TaxID=1348852 RepID=A0A0B2B493_9ACTN|nr:DUF1801 domain-containing protein [Mumia flava]PJJ53431.1 uncharacterized protein YdhG (YjbR/CyaY superfamily) [Mumia flava]